MFIVCTHTQQGDEMKRLIQWHKNILNDMVHYFGLSLYQTLWIAFAKGILIGYLIGEYL